MEKKGYKFTKQPTEMPNLGENKIRFNPESAAICSLKHTNDMM
jgi:hypothetical protein